MERIDIAVERVDVPVEGVDIAAIGQDEFRFRARRRVVPLTQGEGGGDQERAHGSREQQRGGCAQQEVLHVDPVQ